MKEFREINEALDRCCQLALGQPQSSKQVILMTDAKFQAAGYAVLKENDPNQKYTLTRKTYAPIAFRSKTYSPSQNERSIFAKEFLPFTWPSMNMDKFFGVPPNHCLS